MVKHATHVRTKKQYAVKVMNIAESTRSGDEDGMTIEEIADEIRLTMSLTHPQVVKIYDFYKAENHVYVVMELLKGGELLEAVISMGHYSERDAAIIMKQLFTGLVGVHAQNITHRDLKLENLILAEEGDVTSLRIADFGLAKKMKTARGKLSAQCGSPARTSPPSSSRGRRTLPRSTCGRPGASCTLCCAASCRSSRRTTRRCSAESPRGACTRRPRRSAPRASTSSPSSSTSTGSSASPRRRRLSTSGSRAR